MLEQWHAAKAADSSDDSAVWSAAPYVASGIIAAPSQVENEYGYCGSDASYIRHLVQEARQILGDDVILYTTDPPTLAADGSLPGDEVYT